MNWKMGFLQGCLATLLACVAISVSAHTLRVGVYENAPKLFATEDARLSGILGELLTEIAAREGWQLEAVSCSWSQCLRWLASGHIDLMPDVAVNSARTKQFDFHTVPALLNWSQIYESREQRLTSLLDLDGKRVAVLRDSIQQDYLVQVADSFGLTIFWVGVDSLEEGFEAVRGGIADAAVANQLFGDSHAQSMGLVTSPILFQPNKLFYAATPGRHEATLATIDDYLRRWQADNQSPYFKILYRWSVQPEQPMVPVAVWWGMAVLIAVLLLVLGFTGLLRQQVRERTRRLRASEARLNTILDSVDAYIYIKDPQLHYQYANRKVCDLLGILPAQIVGQRDEDFFDAGTCAALREHDLRVIDQGERVVGEETNTMVSGKRHIFLSIKLPLCNPDGSIYALCGISTDITEHREVQDQLHQLAFFDPLTGLANRRLLLDRLRHALANREKTGFEGALLLLDLDDFKTLNDTLGHDSGDLLLQQVARRLEMNVRSTDTACRLGADEFVMILEDLSRDPQRAVMEARNVVQNIVDRLVQPYDLNGAIHVASVSVGVIMFSDTEGSVDSLLKGGDLALHAAQMAGRNTLRFFNPKMQIEVNRRTVIEAALRRAIDNNQLMLHVQPQVMTDGRVIGMEALLRWNDPELGIMSPGDFIPVAEASGLIVPLGEWVLRRACWLLAEWAFIPGMEELTLAVNISPEQFRAPHFVTHLEECIRLECVNPALLELEVTESLLIDDMEVIAERMHQLRARGIRFSLDDFGTGYASLGYLKSLPLYQLKIDQSFVRDLMTDPNDEAIVRTIIVLGQSLDLQVIAEGVETEAQARRLQELGCTVYQGYYFGRPDTPVTWQKRLEASGYLLV